MDSLKSIADFDFVYDMASVDNSRVVALLDSDYAGDLDKWRSLTGYVSTKCNCIISWKATIL